MAELLYEGKAKQVYKTEKEDEYLIHYKDDATAGKVVFKTTEEYTDFMDLSHFIKNCQYTRNSVK